jgi:hypothetical protein
MSIQRRAIRRNERKAKKARDKQRAAEIAAMPPEQRPRRERPAMSQAEVQLFLASMMALGSSFGSSIQVRGNRS